MPNLAIVIPAFKKAYFSDALSCLANQTCKDFNVYIGDDNSPENLEEIISSFNGRLNISYTKFGNNIGAKNLVRQWVRCVELSKEEEWIWLFSDDDLVDDNCVENFYKKLKAGSIIDVYRFNTVVINYDGTINYRTPISPIFESSEEMAYNLLLGKRGNSMADHIFSRRVYNASGGFIFTEYAQGADWAISMLFSREKGIATINGSNFYWRYNGGNVSSTSGKKKSKMFNGHVQFIEWVVEHFGYLRNGRSNITYEMIMDAARINLKNVILYHYKGLSLGNVVMYVSLTKQAFKLSYFEIFQDLIFLLNRTTKRPIKFKRLKSFIKLHLKTPT